MGAMKMTFTLDEATVGRLRQAARRLSKPQSEIVREAITEYYGRLGKLGDDERSRLLAVFDDVIPRIPNRPAAAVDRELDEIRRSRRASGERRSRPAK